jgi:RNA polymerase sigma-70 factor (sigma-E family)
MHADNERAYADYVRGRMTALRRTSYYLCGDWHEADEVLQLALIKLYRHWPRAAAAEAPDAYVRRMLVNVFLEHRTSWWHRHVRPRHSEPELASAQPEPEGRLDLLAALARVSPGQRAVLVLRYWEGLDVAETAHVLGCSPGTVKSQTSYAVAALRKLMPEYTRDYTTEAR